MTTMLAAVIHAPGGPEVLKLEDRPVPVPRAGEVLIRVKAFGLNRSELFTRQGHSPDVAFPRVLGIEAVGLVVAAPGGEFAPGDVVATAMGGMGRQYDGSYAQFTCVPATQVRSMRSGLPWETLGAVPEMLQTAWGSLVTALDLTAGDEVVVDTGAIASAVRSLVPQGVNKVLELVGTTTLKDSLRCAHPRGVVCMTGMVGNQWSFEQFSPMDAIPSTVRLTTYDGGVADFMATPYDELLALIDRGALRLPVGEVFALADIVEAHRCMEENRAGGKIVVLT
jgi:NADPH:quinone reductase-like Zn-dependent oxidoreductase